MKKIKPIIAIAILSMLFTSCSDKEELYSVQGTVRDCETNEPIEGLNVDISESDYFYSSNNEVKTDSNGQFIVHLETENSFVYVQFSNENGAVARYITCEGDSVLTEKVNSPNTTTIEASFTEWKLPDTAYVNGGDTGLIGNTFFIDTATTLLNIVFISNARFASPHNDISGRIINPEVIHNGDKNVQITNGVGTHNWGNEPFQIYSGKYVHYEVTFRGEWDWTASQSTFVVIDSVFVPYSTKLLTDTIYH